MNAIPSPVYYDGMVFLMSGFQGNDLRAARIAQAKGDIDDRSAGAWSHDRDTSYFHSRLEWVSVRDMEEAVEVIVQLAQVWEERS